MASSSAVLMASSLAAVDSASLVTPETFSDTSKVVSVYVLGVGAAVGGDAVGGDGEPIR